MMACKSTLPIRGLKGLLVLCAVSRSFCQAPMAGDSVIQAVAGRAVPTVRLWAGDAPGEKPGAYGPEKIQDTLGRRVRITNVTVPTFSVFSPARNNTGIAVLIAPGGGYSYLVIDAEGVDFAKKLNSYGITGIVLKYRCPARSGLAKQTAGFQDAQRAMAMIKARASEWGIDSSKTGFCGFSAGGHLGALASSRFSVKTYPYRDAFDSVSSHPAFTILTYPAYLSNSDTLVTSVRKETAPYLFLTMGSNDDSFIGGYNQYVAMLTSKGVAFESSILTGAQHGYGMDIEPYATQWSDKAVQMLLKRYPTTGVGPAKTKVGAKLKAKPHRYNLSGRRISGNGSGNDVRDFG